MLRHFLTALVALAGVALATPAFPHATLLATEPADGTLLAEPPAELTLTFNEPVDPTVLTLIAPGGESSELRDFERRGDMIVIPAPALGDGTHVMTWRAVSDDGHPIGGAFVFSVGEVTGAAAPTAAATDPALRALIWTARVAIYLALFIGAAGAFFTTIIAGPARVPAAARHALRAITIAGLVAAPIAFALQGVDLLGASLGAAFTPRAWEMALGTSYAATVIVAMLTLVAALVALSGRGGRIAGALALLGVGVALALSGHASRAPPEALSWLVVLIHATAVAFWTGALLPLAALLRTPGPGAVAALGRFSAIIPHALAPLVAAGGLLVFIQLERVSDLWTTDYGRLLLAKLIAVAALFALAAYNRYRITPRLRASTADAARRLRRSIVIELMLVLVVFGFVAGWRFTPPPRALAAATEAMAAAAAAATPAVPFYTHLHDLDMALDLTVTPARVGPVTITLGVLTTELTPLPALEVAMEISNQAAGIGGIEREATLMADGTWQASGIVLPVAGTWAVKVTALVSDFDRRDITGLIVVADPNAPRAAIAAPADEFDHAALAPDRLDPADATLAFALPVATAPGIAMAVAPAPAGQWDVALQVERFAFAPEGDGSVPRGHAHLFVDGAFVAELAAPHHRLYLARNGVFAIDVGLAGADHRALVAGGRPIAARTMLRLTPGVEISGQRLAFDVGLGLPAMPITVPVGATVELRVSSDIERTVRLEGYGIATEVGPRAPVTLLFNADLAGRFAAREEGADRELFTLEVTGR